MAHDLRRLDGALELGPIGVVVQDAELELVVLDAGGRAQLLQRRAAVERELHDLRDVLARAPRQALGQEAQAPRPLVRIHAQPEEQRRVVPPDPLQDLAGRVGIRPRLGVAHGDLAAVGEGRLEPRLGAALEHGHFMARGGEIPGAGDADHPGA